MSGIISRLSALSKAGLGLAAGALALFILNLALPGSGLFFPLVSLWLSLALFVLALAVLRVSGVELDLFHRAVLVGVWAAALLYAFWALNSRTFIYHWDYANYIIKQYNAEAVFLEGAGAGFKFILDSITEDYTNFITLFTEFPFCLSGKTGDDYAFCQVFSILPTLLVLLAGLVVKTGQMLRVKNRFWYFLIGLGWCVTFPFLRMSAMLGQPDWFGLIFAFMLMLLTLSYRFDHIDIPRYLLVFAATAGVILTRRWYLYFVVGYCFAYVLLLVFSSVRLAKSGQQPRAVRRIVRLAVFGLCAAAAMVLLLLPMVIKILGYDYAGRYSYYNVGGIQAELSAQFFRIGLLNFILIGLGLWFAVKRRLPALPCLAGCELAVSLVLFTRVQNTGSHQMLLFVPGWFLLFLVGAAALADGIRRHRNLKIAYWVFNMVFALSVRCSPLTIVALPGFVVDHFPLKSVAEFVRLDKLTYDRTDADAIQALDDWIDVHCGDGEYAYMIPHDMLYNSDVFQNAALPDIQLKDKLCAGISIPGTHEFPVRFFDAKYVITAEPFPQTFVSDGELSGRWNELFCAERDDYFTQAASFDMGNGTVFTVWERTDPADRAEVEYYLNAFAQEDALYPEMFSQVAEAWLAERGL